MKKAKEAMKKQFDKKRQKFQKLEQGDNIWLETKNIQLKQSLKKLNQKNMDHLNLQRILMSHTI